MTRARSRAARRQQDRLRERRRVSRAQQARGTLTFRPPQLWRVTVPANTPDEQLRKEVRDLFLDGLRRFDLNAQPANVRDDVLGIAIEVEAADEQAARSKALYWCGQAARHVRGLRWHTPPREFVTVEAI